MTTPMTTPTTTPAPRSGVLRKRSRSAVARSAAGDRGVVAFLGLVLLTLGVLVVLLSLGVFGTGRAGLPVLDPVVLAALRGQELVSRLVAIGVGLLLFVLGLVRAARSLRPEPRPDLVLDRGPETAITVSSGAAAEAIGAQAETLPGVARARARLVGTDDAPALRLTAWLTDDADVREVTSRLHDDVLGDARGALGLEALPVAVRLELDSGSTSRVA
jgi:hypothetical protein